MKPHHARIEILPLFSRQLLLALVCISFSIADVASGAVADFFTVQQGTVPILVTAPHGGSTVIPGITDRTSGVLVRDADTDKLAQAFSDEFFSLTGQLPYVVIAHAPRTQIDFNRADGINSYEDPNAQPYHQYYHGAVRSFVDQIRGNWNDGLLLDLHGHGGNGFTIFRGTRNGLGVTNMLSKHGEEALNGPESVLGKLDSIGKSYFPGGEDILIDPDLTIPFNLQLEDPDYDGGFTIRTYGSDNNNGIDAIQLEFGSRFRQRDPGWSAFAPDLALATETYRLKYLTAVPEPSSLTFLMSCGVALLARRSRRRTCTAGFKIRSEGDNK